MLRQGSHTHKQTRQTAASRGVTSFINFTRHWKLKQTLTRSKLYKRPTPTNSRPLEANIVKVRNGVMPRLSHAQPHNTNELCEIEKRHYAKALTRTNKRAKQRQAEA